MLCSPATAQRAIDGLSEGRALFIPMGYMGDLQLVDYGGPGRLGPIEWPKRLNLISYYLLVIYSLTGLSTLLGLTRTLVAEECNLPLQIDKGFQSKYHPNLQVKPDMLAYLVSEAGGDKSSGVVLKRHFAYSFGGLAPIDVIMLHIECNNKLSLLEVYHCHNPLVQWILDNPVYHAVMKHNTKSKNQ
jgi:hypothetical protein